MKKMYRFYFVAAVLIITTISLSWYTEDQNLASQSYTDIPAPPPLSLDAFYPPNTGQPLYLFAMLGLETPFTGIMVDLMEQDFENAGKNYEKFKHQYLEVSKMVPEWENSYPIEPVEELGQALNTGDKQLIMTAFEKAGSVCHNCHVHNMTKVQHKYHWKDFQSVTLNDQVTNENIDFTQLMRFISINYTGIGVNFEEGQIGNAKIHFEQFKKRFMTLRASCTHCHSTERKYYVDETVRSAIDRLEVALNETKPDPILVGNLSMQIGYESCSKCHLVHTPSAFTKHGWKLIDSEKIRN